MNRLAISATRSSRTASAHTCTAMRSAPSGPTFVGHDLERGPITSISGRLRVGHHRLEDGPDLVRVSSAMASMISFLLLKYR